MGSLTAMMVMVAIVAAAVSRRHRYRERYPADGAQLPSAAAVADMERELAELRRRVAVLERIATEDRRGRALAAEIEALREP